jgi:hypothetical protein
MLLKAVGLGVDLFWWEAKAIGKNIFDLELYLGSIP